MIGRIKYELTIEGYHARIQGWLEATNPTHRTLIQVAKDAGNDDVDSVMETNNIDCKFKTINRRLSEQIEVQAADAGVTYM